MKFSWVLMAFEKYGIELIEEISLPEAIDESVVRALVGDYPNLRGDSFPVGKEILDHLQQFYGVESDLSVCEYFIECRGEE